MRHMEWILAVTLVAAVMAPLALEAQAAQPVQVSAQDSADLQEYAQRDAGSGDLEEFVGGSHGVVLVVVLVVAVLVLVALILPW
jgi:hypothetical protein